jgi:hypothetical protein
MERPVVDDDLRARLSAVLKPEADEFRTITGRAFARWSV